RVAPQKNKLTIIESKPWEEYKIGILPGNRGGKIQITEESYVSREKAEHAITVIEDALESIESTDTPPAT
ncbi:hypothetical protein HN451_00090, partial [archaeon]|nr:hypothetical protein [archaeon]